MKFKPTIQYCKKQLEKGSIQFIFLFSLIFLRYLFFGFQYYYMLDDYIQHHNYAFGTGYQWDLIWQNLNQLGLLSFRPLAGLLDLTLWSMLFDHMILGVALITLLYAGSALLFYKVLQDFVPCSPLFLVIYSMIPLGFEGTYWMSASTRIIPGLFFTALAAYCFHQFCKTGKKKQAVFFFLAQCLSYCFYEQCLVLSITAIALLSIYYFFKARKRSLLGLSFLASLGVYWGITHFASSADIITTRTEIILPSPYYFNVFLPELLSQLKSAFLGGGFYTITKGFVRGIQIVFSQSGYVYLLLSILLSALILLLPKQKEEKNLSSLWGFVIGFLLFLAPISIFFVIANPWFSLRGTVVSFCGIALMIDSLWGVLAKKLPKSQHLQGVTAALLSFLSLIACVSELSDYKDTYEDDLQVVSTLYPTWINLDLGAKIAVVGIETSYLDDQNFQYHEHLHGVTESDWALTGALTAYAKSPVPAVIPIPVNTPAYFPYHGGGKRLETMDLIYYYDHQEGSLQSLRLEIVEPEVLYHLYSETGELFGILEETDGRGEITLE